MFGSTHSSSSSSSSFLYSQYSPHIKAKLASLQLSEKSTLADFNGNSEKRVPLANLLRIGDERAIQIVQSAITDGNNEQVGIFFKDSGVQKIVLKGVMEGTLTHSFILDQLKSCDVVLSESDGASIWSKKSALMLGLVAQHPDVLLVLRFLQGKTAQSAAMELIKDRKHLVLENAHFHALITKCGLSYLKPSQKVAFFEELKVIQKIDPTIQSLQSLNALIEKFNPTKAPTAPGKSTGPAAVAAAEKTAAPAKNTVATTAFYVVSVIAMLAAVMYRKELSGLAGVVPTMPLGNLDAVSNQYGGYKIATTDPMAMQLQPYVSPYAYLPTCPVDQKSGPGTDYLSPTQFEVYLNSVQSHAYVSSLVGSPMPLVSQELPNQQAEIVDLKAKKFVDHDYVFDYQSYLLESGAQELMDRYKSNQSVANFNALTASIDLFAEKDGFEVQSCFQRKDELVVQFGQRVQPPDAKSVSVSLLRTQESGDDTIANSHINLLDQPTALLLYEGQSERNDRDNLSLFYAGLAVVGSLIVACSKLGWKKSDNIEINDENAKQFDRYLTVFNNQRYRSRGDVQQLVNQCLIEPTKENVTALIDSMRQFLEEEGLSVVPFEGGVQPFAAEFAPADGGAQAASLLLMPAGVDVHVPAAVATAVTGSAAGSQYSVYDLIWLFYSQMPRVLRDPAPTPTSSVPLALMPVGGGAAEDESSVVQRLIRFFNDRAHPADDASSSSSSSSNGSEKSTSSSYNSPYRKEMDDLHPTARADFKHAQTHAERVKVIDAIKSEAEQESGQKYAKSNVARCFLFVELAAMTNDISLKQHIVGAILDIQTHQEKTHYLTLPPNVEAFVNEYGHK